MGSIDDLRVYGSALSQGQIVTTMGLAQLYFPVPSLAELYDSESEGQRAINFKDFAVLAVQWLEKELYPDW